MNLTNEQYLVVTELRSVTTQICDHYFNGYTTPIDGLRQRKIELTAILESWEHDHAILINTAIDMGAGDPETAERWLV